ncbi:MAG: class I SAM-dependent methyltransferase [Clostridia bacterium]|nr:class I SAM-dependent methyltransferase [Clostridia bacterium]
MRGKLIENVTLLSQWMLPNMIKPGMRCIDATAGNGYDTLFLSNQVGAHGFVYAFDIQEAAVEATEKLLEESPYLNHKVILDSHALMTQYIHEPVDFVVFNLGYLPKADKSITTKKESTLVAIDEALKLLKCHGILWIVVYPGHEAGQEESEALSNYLSGFEQKNYSVLKMAFMNQKNNPPYIWAIEKKFEEKT